MRFTRITVTLVLGVLVFAAAGSAALATSDASVLPAKNGIYIVQMVASPAVAYTGGVAGYAATKPDPGQKIDPYATKTVRYGSYLKSLHAAALAKVGGGDKLYDYVFTYDGFAAKLTPGQADALAQQPDVVAVSPDVIHTVDTSSTPAFLGLTDPGGLWDQLGGPTGGKKGPGAGEGIIIGDIDSGIWPDSKSFSDRDATGKLVMQQIPGWHGKCTPGEKFVASDCNQKLIGAQWFDASWGGDAALKAQRPWEFASARDYNGHGTHTASTAAGDNGVKPTGAAAAFGPLSGIAPRARIAMYKALWSTEDASTASGSTSDLVAAIDQAVADGVDVINYSISGTLTDFADPAEIAFLYAANAGIFVSASAGNSGPTTGTVAHPSPWITTVAAGTHNRNGEGSVTLGNGVTYYGASVATAVGPAPFIDSEAAGLPGANPTALRLCFAAIDNGGLPVLDPVKVAGKIVLCDRGTNARVNKSLAVQEAGGVGMVLANTSPNSLNADFHFVPSVHIADTDRAAVKAYAATPDATATINQATIVNTAPAPFTASFSSRGPLQAGGGDLLKPDVIAPGQDILAAVAPPGNHGMDFNLYSGTSMSAPHVAGLAALLMQAHPTWTPMMVKSALMTSAYDVLDGPNTNPLVIFRQGAGHVRPNDAVHPGLVYASGWNDWLAFMCGTTKAVSAGTCTALHNMGYSLDPSDLNVPSIAIGDLAGIQTVTRKVTNVGTTAATYTASVTGMLGFAVTIQPSVLTLNPGQTKSFQVTFTRTTAALNTYTGGQLTWTDGAHNVRIPLVIRPVALAAPAQVSGSYNVTFGYNGAFSVTPRGLVPAQTFEGSVSTDPDGVFNPGEAGDTVSYDVVVPAGTTYARFSLFNANTAPASDLDLYVYRGSTLVGSSGGGTADEEVNLLNPVAATYTVWIHGFATGNPTTFTSFAWVLDSTDAGNMTVSAPSTAVIGQQSSINVGLSGLTSGTKYLGSIVYAGVSGMPNPTIVRVDAP